MTRQEEGQPDSNRASRWAAVLLLGMLLSVAPTFAQTSTQPPAVTVLLHHPNDGVDPFGFVYASRDGFTARYSQFADGNGRFPYPFFVADGAIPIAAIPEPARPYDSARQAYGQAVAQRQVEEAPLQLRLTSVLRDGIIIADIAAVTNVELSSEDLHFWLAVAEDPVHYQPPAGLTNGITEHRFTVRALTDAGKVLWANGTATTQWRVPVGSWNEEKLLVAAWVQQDAPTSRFDAREVVQATNAPVGATVMQATKGVLVEVLSATWCDPCLYGDLAVEDLAISLGSAQPLSQPRTRYFEAPPMVLLVATLSIAVGLAVAAAGRRNLK